MKKLLLLISIVVCGIMMQSCMTTRTPVGDYYQAQHTERYSKSKQAWLFFGLVPLGRTHTNTPNDGRPCMIEEKYTFGDVVLNGLCSWMLGLHFRTIKCYVAVDNGYSGYSGNAHQPGRPQTHPLVGARVSWQTPQGGTRYGTVTNMRTPSTCEVKTEDTGSTIVITLDKLTKAN